MNWWKRGKSKVLKIFRTYFMDDPLDIFTHNSNAIMLKSNEANSDGLNEPSLVVFPVNMPRGRPQLRLDGGAEDGLGVQPLGQGGAPA